MSIGLRAAAAHEAGAQGGGEGRCAEDGGGEDGVGAARVGGGSLVVLGAVFVAVWFMPPRANAERGVGCMDSLPVMGALQRRIDKELTGWRRFQWPLIGLSFMLLGFAFLFGWM